MLFLFLNNYDNKYTKKAELLQAADTSILPERGFCFLADGWKLYPDVLLKSQTPDSSNIKEYTTWIGEFPNLAPFHADSNPYGVCTYQLTLSGNGIKTLYLPEPMSAANVYLNDTLLGSVGLIQKDSYAPQIKDSFYTFMLDGLATLTIETANYSHYYGGLYYPPAIGDSDSITRIISFRTIFYGFLCFSSLTLAGFNLFLWITKKERTSSVTFYFGMLCLAFAIWISYPFYRLAGIPSVRPLYALADTCSMLCIYFSFRIAALLFPPKEGASCFFHISFPICFGMCIITAIFPLLFLPVFPSFTFVYGQIISWYKLISACILALCCLRGYMSSIPQFTFLFLASTVNAICLVIGILTINLYEPIYTGWPDEYGTYFMVLAFATICIQKNHAIQTENLHLTIHLQEEVENQTSYLNRLLHERQQLMTELGHDLKSPLTSLSNMAQIIQQNNIFLDAESKKKMQTIEAHCALMADRLRSLQEFTPEDGSSSMEELSLNHFLTNFHRNLKPVIELQGPDFNCHLTTKTCTIMGNENKLTRALENLVFNAAYFTPPEGKIELILTLAKGYAHIQIKDNGCGISKQNLPKIFKHFYTTKAEDGGQGMGLLIVKNIVLEHRGEIDVISEPQKGTLFTIKLPLRCS